MLCPTRARERRPADRRARQLGKGSGGGPGHLRARAGVSRLATLPGLAALSFLAALLLPAPAAGGQSPPAAEADADSVARAVLPPDLEPGSGTTLEALIVEALAASPRREAAAARWQAAREASRAARAWPEPQLSYSYFLREVETRVGPQRQKLSLTQSLPWFGKRGLRGAAASAMAEAREAQWRAVRAEITFQVADVYLEHAYLTRALALLRESAALLADEERVARTRYAAGTVTHPDLLEVQIALGRFTERLASLEARQRPVRIRLNLLLGRPEQAPLPAELPLPDPPFEIPASGARELLAENSPELALLDAGVLEWGHRHALARRTRFPDVAVGIDYIETGPPETEGIPDAGRDPIALRVSLALPLSRGSYAAAIQGTEARRVAARAERRAREDQLVAEFEEARFRIADAARLRDLYRDTLRPKAEQLRAGAVEAFRTGRIGMQDLIDAQRTLLDLQLAETQARIDYLRAIAALGHLLGRVGWGD